jgi:UDP-N-acetylmuramoylalanine--D-glutamate ligase
MDAAAYFKGKRITVMGLGLLGRGVGDAAYLAECGADVLVTDLKSADVLADSVAKLRAFSNITFVLGEHRVEDFEDRDMILVAAGVPMDSPYLAHAREHGVRLAMSGALFAELSGIPIIGVTGTRGKSTVTHLIHHTLTHATEGAPVLLGGNVRGVSNLQLLNEVTPDSIAVMELDSWQLQGFGWAELSPHIAVFTNFMEDHMNYYHGDTDAYFGDKANIFRYQEDADVLVTTLQVFERAREFAKGKQITLGQQVILADASVLPEDALLSMPGEHNRLNAALAYEALKATSLTDDEIFEAFATFPGVPGRLQFVREVHGAKVYNDNNATTPQATVAALRALGYDTKNVVLIMGGADKGLPLEELIAEVQQRVKRVVLLPGTGTDRVRELLRNVETVLADSLDGAVEAAVSSGGEGDVVLFSPAFASFGLFANEYERNDQFMARVESL